MFDDKYFDVEILSRKETIVKASHLPAFPYNHSHERKPVRSNRPDGPVTIWDINGCEPQPSEPWPIAEACRRANRNLTVAECQHYFGEKPYRESCSDDQAQ